MGFNEDNQAEFCPMVEEEAKTCWAKQDKEFHLSRVDSARDKLKDYSAQSKDFSEDVQYMWL